MKRTFLFSLLPLLHASVAHAGAFPTCEDAAQYGANTGQLYTGQVFARIACDETRLPRAHDTLSRVLSTQVLRTSDDDATKLCFYRGLMHGVTERVTLEYARCGDCAGFACVDRLVMVDAAGGVVRALSQALLDPSRFDEAAAASLFPAPADGPWCEAPAFEDCVDVLTSRAGVDSPELESIAARWCPEEPVTTP